METGSVQTLASIDELILVNSNNDIVGYMDKESAHDGSGVLHRAFSVFLRNAKGEILLQKRSRQKRLWPDFWSNAVCSHPRKGEESDTAAHRRLQEELNTDTSLQYLYSFEYQARFGELGSEHEFCNVYWGIYDTLPTPNPDEISELMFIAPDDLSRRIDSKPEDFTPWFKMEWQKINAEFAELLD